MKNFLSSLLATIIGILIMTFVVCAHLYGNYCSIHLQRGTRGERELCSRGKIQCPDLDRTNDRSLFPVSFGEFHMTESMGLNQILKDLDKAKTDEKIKGIFMNLVLFRAGIATLGEISEALAGF